MCGRVEKYLFLQNMFFGGVWGNSLLVVILVGV